MQALRRYYSQVWAIDFEFTARPGERPVPLCLVGKELWSGRLVRCWLADNVPASPLFPLTSDTLYVAYYASAELGCFLAFGWPFPPRMLDLYAEFRCLTSGRAVPCGYGLLGALTYFGLDGLGAQEKEAMRLLAMRGGPYSAQEQRDLLDYCQSDVDALARLLPAMLPSLDLPRALLRGRYMGAAARIEWAGIPVDMDTLSRLQGRWDHIRARLAREMNRTCRVFVLTGQRPINPQTRLGAALLKTATERDLDPYALARVVDQLWQEAYARYAETIMARREARQATGLSHVRINRWEDAGHDYSSWPGLDDTAHELAGRLPELGIGPGAQYDGGYDDTDYAARLWDLLRDSDDRLPARHDPAILDRAADLLDEDPEASLDDGPLTFSGQRFELYLTRHGIPWPRLDSGALALDDDTFREMAKAYPAAIGPIREVRHALSQLKLHALAVGSDGRNRCLLSAFSSRTGRNQPSNSAYIFGPSCWLRSLIQPGPGRALAYVDWSQQELAIAAALSGDQAMQEAYQSGDLYLTFAKMAGAVPPEATKATHRVIREHYKTVALGVLYGLSERGLARRLGVPLCEARLLLQRHKEAFPRFWAWSDRLEMEGMLGGTLQTVYGWRLTVGPNVNRRSLRNFPMQANGADMMRLACCLATERGITVCAVVHDALLIEADLDGIETAAAQSQQAMREASELVLPGFPLRTEAKLVRYPERYQDPRGVQMWEMVHHLLDELDREEAGYDTVPF